MKNTFYQLSISNREYAKRKAQEYINNLHIRELLKEVLQYRRLASEYTSLQYFDFSDAKNNIR